MGLVTVFFLFVALVGSGPPLLGSAAKNEGAETRRPHKTSL
jgi:hypothetical protein